MIVVICGSISIRRLPHEGRVRIGTIINLNAQVLVGDAFGVDLEVQQELNSRGYRNVVVYHRGEVPRNNVGGWPTVAVQGSYTDRDRRMCGDADYGLAIWDGISRGTGRNITQLGARMRVVRT